MISGIDLSATVDYVCKDDKENPTTWKLGMVSSNMLGKLSAGVTGSEIDMAYKLLQLTIKGWVNFSEEYKTVKENIFGQEIDVVPVSVLGRIPLKVITELSAKVLEINGLSKEEQKNS